MLSYDRRVPETFLDALRPGGWAGSLAEYARGGQYSLDLQLRGYGLDQAHHWATLYVGLTKVVDLHHHTTKGFRLAPGSWYKQGWSAGWGEFAPRLDATTWSAVEDFLEKAIPEVGEKHLKEGAVQSALSSFRNRNLIVVDREAAISFSDKPERVAVGLELQHALLAALDPPDGAAWWKARPSSLGGECDAVAVAADGAVLAIEVKPAKATGTIPWAGLQVRQYARLFTRWANENRAQAASIIGGMVDQRVQLGLAGEQPPQCADPVTVRPVLAIGRGVSNEVIRRLCEVERRLAAAGLDDPPLEVFTVNLVGRLDPVNLHA